MTIPAVPIRIEMFVGLRLAWHWNAHKDKEGVWHYDASKEWLAGQWIKPPKALSFDWNDKRVYGWWDKNAPADRPCLRLNPLPGSNEFSWAYNEEHGLSQLHRALNVAPDELLRFEWEAMPDYVDISPPYT